MILMEKLDKVVVAETKTTNFILPLLGLPISAYRPFLVNAYLDSLEVRNDSEYSIQIMLRFYGSSSFVNIEKQILNMEGFQNSYTLYDGKFIVYMVDIPEELKPDYDKILMGKYSRVSQKAKSLILEGRHSASSMPKVLSKSPELRKYWEKKLSIKGSPVNLKDQEVWPILDLRQEVFSKTDFPVKDSAF